MLKVLSITPTCLGELRVVSNKPIAEFYCDGKANGSTKHIRAPTAARAEMHLTGIARELAVRQGSQERLPHVPYHLAAYSLCS